MTEPEQNPYAPGTAVPGAPAAAAAEIVPGTFDIGEVFSSAFEILRRHWLMGSVGVLIFFVMSMAASFATAGVEVVLNLAVEGTGTVVGTLINYIVQIPIGFGGTWLGYQAVLKFRRDEDVEVEAVFQGFKSFMPVLKVSLLQLAIMALVMLPGVIVIGVLVYVLGDQELLDNPVEVLDRFELLASVGLAGFVLIFLPALYVSIRLYFSVLITVDRDRAPLDAIKDSLTLTGEATWTLVGFMLLWGLLLLVSSPIWLVGIAITCGLGIFPFGFLNLAITGLLYDRLTGGRPTTPS